MEYQNKILKCLALLKQAFKQQGIRYQHLAQALEVSEVTIKRWLNSDDLPMSRLLALAELAGYEFDELWQAVESKPAAIQFFTPEQDRAFYQYPHLYGYFNALMVPLSPKEIAKRWQLSPASTHLYLRKLESLGLIRVTEAQQVRILVQPPLGFDENSLMVRKEIAAITAQVSEQMLAEPQTHKDFLLLKPLVLPDDLRQAFYQRIYETLSEFAELSERFFRPEQTPVSWFCCLDWPAQPNQGATEIINIRGWD